MRESAAHDRESVPSSPHIKVEVLSTFVADPILETLRYWFNEFEYAAELLPTYYGQLFPRLFRQDETHGSADIHVVLFAIRDLVPEKDRRDLSAETPHANIDEFVRALEVAISASSGAWIVVRCPDPPADAAGVSRELNQQAEHIAAETRRLARTAYIDAGDLGGIYEIESCFDEISDRHGHMPYTDAYYAAIGTLIFRAIRARLGQVYKLIVTDCDGTLWGGICGEVEPHELSILSHHVWLHEFLQSKRSAGTLLAICSHNNIDDVHAVFAQREDLGLSLDDFANARINWNDKADNLRELAQALNIALNSVIFLDNDPVQRNRIRAALPQVLVPDLSANPNEWPFYLEHVWAFDSFWVTEEASKRHSFYREHAARESIRSGSASLAQFLRQLRLRVSVEAATEHDLSRIFELVHRVTQFNTNESRPNESSIRRLMLHEGGEWLAVRVEDRFGDYGLVGAVSCRYEPDYCFIGSFLLSCRALGRGVETQMLRAIGKRARANGIGEIRFAVAETRRNSPAIDYLKRLGMSASDLRAGSFRLDAARAVVQSDDESLPRTGSTHRPARTADEDAAVEADGMTNAAAGEAERILEAAKSVRNLDDLYHTGRLIVEQAGRTGDKTYTAPRSETEKTIVGIFEDLLGHDNFGVDEEFFDVGGHSLLVMRLLSRIKAVFAVDLPIRTLFIERLTIENLARIVEKSSTLEENSAELESIRNALDALSDEEIAGLFGDLGHTDNNDG